MEAGSILELELPFESAREYKYWDMMQVAHEGQSNLFSGTEEEAADELERLIKGSVSGQMVADVPVGAFLSGGTDSTTIAAVMQSLSRDKIKTFTIGFHSSSFDEAAYARETAHYLGTDHTELYLTDKEAQAVIPKLAYIYGEPFADSSQIPTYLVSKLAKESVTVSLSGDGGDELFCGYNSYKKAEKLWGALSGIPYPLRFGISKVINNEICLKVPKMAAVHQYFPAKSGEQLYEFAAISKNKSNGIMKEGQVPPYKLNQDPARYLPELSNNIMLMDLQVYHPDDILVKVERAGMAVSLESRIPFLDKDIIEFAWSLPITYKYSDGIGKKVLKKVLYRYVPKKMMDRPKKGFSVPIYEWLREGDLKMWAEELMDGNYLRQQGILDEKRVKAIWNDFMEHGKWHRILWHILMFEEWYQKRAE